VWLCGGLFLEVGELLPRVDCTFGGSETTDIAGRCVVSVVQSLDRWAACGGGSMSGRLSWL